MKFQQLKLLKNYTIYLSWIKMELRPYREVKRKKTKVIKVW